MKQRSFLAAIFLLFTTSLFSQYDWTWVRGSNTSSSKTAKYGTKGVPSTTNTPGGRSGSTTWTDSNGNLWLFGGLSDSGTKADLWKYNPATDEWTWVKGPSGTYDLGVYGTMGVSNPTNMPGCHNGAIGWTDGSGNLWMFGGDGNAASTGGELNDVWKYNIATDQWTWMKGSNASNQPANFGTLGVASASTDPGARQGFMGYKDASHNLWIFGGYKVSIPGSCGDLWKFDIMTNNWTWVSGSSLVNQSGSYGTKGVASSTNMPGSHYASALWVENNNVWLFGGRGYFLSGGQSDVNDLWKYDISNNTWTWMSGANTPTAAGVYGSRGVPSFSAVPGARYFNGNPYMADNSGNLWLMGGANSANGVHNDVWRYSTSTGQWTWMKGSTLTNTIGTYGTLGVSTSSTTPGSRSDHQSWKDNSGNFWIYGGRAMTSSTVINGWRAEDLWKYSLCATPATPTLLSVSGASFCGSGSTTLSVNSGTDITSWYASSTSTAALITGTAYVPSGLIASGGSSVYTYYAETASACGAKSSRSALSLTVHAIPVASVSSGTICAGKNFTINPSGASTYTVEGNSFVVNPLSTTSYSIAGTATNGCVSGPTIFTVSVQSQPTISISSGTLCSGGTFTLQPSGADSYTYLNGSATVSPTVTTSYSITGSLAGCVSTNTAVVTVSVLTTPTVSASGGSICAGKSFTIAPAGADVFNISGNTLVVSPSVTSSYSVTGTSTAGCISSNTSIVTISVAPVPTISVSGGTLCSGGSFTLSPSGAVTYTYLNGQSLVSPSVTTSYSITGTGSVGCISSNTAVATVSVFITPTISAAGGTVCSGQAFTISPAGTDTYSITGNTFVVSPSATTPYSVTGSSSAGCASTNTAVLTVSVIALPTISINSGTLCAGNAFTLVPSGASSYTYLNGSAHVSPSVTTSFSVTGTSSLGCVSGNTAVATLTVFQQPTVSANSGSICAGKSFTILPAGASSYSISGSSFTVTPVTTTSYYISGTSSVGCASTNTVMITVTVASQPTLSVNSGSICEGNTFTMLPTGGSNYTYLNGGPNVNPTTTNTYSITGTSASGCAAINTVVATVSVSPAPVITMSGGLVCLGKSFTLSPSGASSYTFLNGGTVVSPTVNTTYSATGTNTAGCISLNPAVATISVAALPVVSVFGPSATCIGNTLLFFANGALTYTWNTGSNSQSLAVQATSVTSYTVAGTDANGCENTATALITVHNLPSVGATASSPAICAGGSVSLNGSGANTYTWSGGVLNNTPFYPSTSGTYTVSGSDTFSCTNTATVAVVVNALPSLSVTTSNSVICAGETAQLNASGASTYTWSTGVNSSFIIVMPSATTNYTVTGTHLNGCSNSFVTSQYVNLCTGISETEAVIGRMYPNPCSEELILEARQQVQIIVLNATGQIVLKQSITEGKNSINLGGYPKGIYFICSESGAIHEKVIKQ